MSLLTERLQDRAISFDPNKGASNGVSRRSAFKAGGVAALAAALSGCTILGQEVSIKPEASSQTDPTQEVPLTPEQETQKALALLHLLESQGVAFNMDGTVVTDNRTNRSYIFGRVVVDDDTCAVYPIYFGPCGPSRPNQPTSVPQQPTPQIPENPGNPESPDKSPAGDQVNPDGENDPNGRGNGQESGDAGGSH